VSFSGIRTVDARTGAAGVLVASPGGQEPFLGAWDPDRSRLLLGWGTFESTKLGWYSPSGGTLGPPIATDTDVWLLQVSPSGDRVAWTTDRTVTMPSGGGARTVVASGGDPVTDWQPCPVGVCARFASPVTRPGAARIGKASPGARGGRATATARWAPPTSNGGSAVTGYRVQARRLNASGAVVKRLTAKRPSGARSYAYALAPGRYRFAVAAVTAKGVGPYSKASNAVRSR
jgi:hypothetical protein